MTPTRQSRVFVEKADEDIHVLKALRDDVETTDAVWGFHAQQAIEKLLKAMLAHYSLRLPFTHRLLDLADILDEGRHAVPAEFETLLDLTVYAVELRYSPLSTLGEPPLDRKDLLEITLAFRSHVRQVIGLDPLR